MNKLLKQAEPHNLSALAHDSPEYPHLCIEAFEHLQDAILDWPEFDDPDEDVNGGDLVDWFGPWRARVKNLLLSLLEPDEASEEPKT